MSSDARLTRLAASYWVMVAAVTFRAGAKLPALLARRAGVDWPVVAVGVALALFVATAPVTIRRARARSAAVAAEYVWTMGIAGLALAGVLLWLV